MSPFSGSPPPPTSPTSPNLTHLPQPHPPPPTSPASPNLSRLTYLPHLPAPTSPWDRLSKENPTPPAVQPSNIFPMATSTPHVPAMNRGEPTLLTNPSLSPNTLELSNTSRVIAAALHHAKLEPPVFAADNKTVFLPSDNQERILRGLLDRIQAQDEPLPTFVAHMLKLSTPFILGMDFMTRASISIHIPTRTVFVDDAPCPLMDEEDSPADFTDLEEVLTRLQSAGLSLKLRKCQFCLEELNFLGYRITSSGIKPDPDKIKAVTEFNTPTTVKHVRQFLGLTGYYRRFIQDYARHAEPLHALTRKDATFQWDDNYLLPEHAVIGSLDIRALPLVLLADRSQIRQLQLDDPVTGPLLRDIETDSQNNVDNVNLPQTLTLFLWTAPPLSPSLTQAQDITISDPDVTPE
uniref:Uncharacterized protein n=1 Tax=Knipowitschia caucasica TaxID=637954 RepID=A0AAV2KLC2_KNICA